MTITPSQLNISEAPVEVMPHGAASRYSGQALNYLTRCRGAAEASAKAELEAGAYLLAFWKQCDDDDAAKGIRPGNGGSGGSDRSTFWQAYEEQRDIPTKFLEASRSTLKDLRQCAEIEIKLLSSTGRTLAGALPLMAAQEAGIAKSTLLMYDRLGSKGQVMAEAALETYGTLKANFIKQITKITQQYPDLYDTVFDGIKAGKFRVPEDVRQLINAYELKKEGERRAEAARAQEQARIKAMEAAELQAAADAKVTTEAAAAVDVATDNLPAGIKPPSVQNSDGPLQRPTYPIQELIDGTAFEGLQKQYEDDTAEFLADMREMSMALNTARKLAKKWHDTMKDRYSTSSVRDMLLWETYSRVWSETGKFKKLGNVTHVFDLYSRFADIAQEVKNFLLVAQPLTKLKRDRWGELVECRTSEEQQRYERK